MTSNYKFRKKVQYGILTNIYWNIPGKADNVSWKIWEQCERIVCDPVCMVYVHRNCKYIVAMSGV